MRALGRRSSSDVPLNKLCSAFGLPLELPRSRITDDRYIAADATRFAYGDRLSSIAFLDHSHVEQHEREHVEEAAEGGYTARALGESIFTEADDVATPEENS